MEIKVISDQITRQGLANLVCFSLILVLGGLSVLSIINKLDDILREIKKR